MSVRKTIEFVSERVASACVKHICAELVPDFKKQCLKEFQMELKSKDIKFDTDADYETTKVGTVNSSTKSTGSIILTLSILNCDSCSLLCLSRSCS